MIDSKNVSPVEVDENLHVSVEPATILTEPWPEVKLAFESENSGLRIWVFSSGYLGLHCVCSVYAAESGPATGYGYNELFFLFVSVLKGHENVYDLKVNEERI